MHARRRRRRAHCHLFVDEVGGVGARVMEISWIDHAAVRKVAADWRGKSGIWASNGGGGGCTDAVSSCLISVQGRVEHNVLAGNCGCNGWGPYSGVIDNGSSPGAWIGQGVIAFSERSRRNVTANGDLDMDVSILSSEGIEIGVGP